MARVYILQSLRDKRYCIGSTNDLLSRLKHHEGGFTYSTKRFGKIICVYSQEYSTLAEARNIERKLKKLKRKDYIEKIVHDRIIKMRA